MGAYKTHAVVRHQPGRSSAWPVSMAMDKATPGRVRVRVRDAWAQAPRTGQLCAGASDGEGKAPRLAPAKAAQGPTHHGGTARYHATCGRGETPGKGPRDGGVRCVER